MNTASIAMRPPSIEPLLSARSVALVGARAESFWSEHAWRNMGAFGFTGDIFLVHPKRVKQFESPCFPSLEAIGQPVDLVLSLTGAGRLEAVLDEAAAAGARGVISIASGLAESGEDGRRLQERLVAKAAALGLTLLGPNCVGFVDFTTGLAPFTDRISPPSPPGPVAIVSQSGALLQLIHRASQRAGVGLSAMFSVGNEAMLSAVDVVDGLLDRDDVRCVAGYLEGIQDPQRFAEVARKALELGKPLVFLKAGRSEGASRLALAHTGSMTGDDRIVDAVFEKYGISRVTSPEELIETSAVLAHQRVLAAGPRVAVVSSSGGACSIAADLVESSVLQLPDLDRATRDRLLEVLPTFGTPQNPLDTTGVVVDRPELLGRSLEVLASSGSFDQVIVNIDLAPQVGPVDDLRDRLDAVVSMCEGLPIPVLMSTTMAGDLGIERRAYVASAGQHVIGGLALAVRAAEHSARWGTSARRTSRGDVEVDASICLPSGVVAMGELESTRLLGRLGLATNGIALATTADEAVRAFQAFGSPVVAKIHSETIFHKSDIGGVKVDLGSQEEVRTAFGELSALAASHDVSGVLIAPMVQDVIAELIVGVVVHPGWDPVIVVGSGGVLAELMDDVALAAAPLDAAGALALVRRTRVFRLLDGYRGGPVVDVQPLVDYVVALSSVAMRLGDRIAAIDLNPVFVTADRVVAGDALVVLAEEEGDTQ